MNFRQTGLVMCMSFGLCASALAANSDQKAITTLQNQIQAVSAQLHQALQTQQASTQKAISGLHSDIQQQIATIQAQMQKMDVQLTNEIKQVQAEVAKVAHGAAPAKAAAPAKK